MVKIGAADFSDIRTDMPILPIILKVKIYHLEIFGTTAPKFTKLIHDVDRSSML